MVVIRIVRRGSGRHWGTLYGPGMIGKPLAPQALADTGALLAVLDRGDRHHSACVAALAAIPLPLATTVAVLTELFHLLAPHEQPKLWALLRSGAVVLRSPSADDLPEIESLMVQYADRPMDFADATLVLLARRERLTTIFTVDRADFETYRIAGKQRFRIVPEV